MGSRNQRVEVLSGSGTFVVPPNIRWINLFVTVSGQYEDHVLLAVTPAESIAYDDVAGTFGALAFAPNVDFTVEYVE